jgi:Alcohol dehydrogenase GroES-like domain/DDE superfamily endonuclease
MQGVVFLGDRKLELRDFPDPTPGPRDVVIEIKASGMCGSDLHVYRAASKPGDTQSGFKRGAEPVIAGHEPCGVVVALGAAVAPHEAKLGQRVMASRSAMERPVPCLLLPIVLPMAKVVQDYVNGTRGKLKLFFLPGYAPELNPDELVWSHMKRTGAAKPPLTSKELLQDRIEADLFKIQKSPALVRSFFKAPEVVYISDG